MRKVTAFLLAVVMVFSMAATAFAASVTQTVDNTSVSAGSDVTVTITLDEAMNNVIGYEYNLYFNSDLFSVKESSGSATVSNVLNNATKGSYLMISYVDPTSEGVTVSAGTLTAITFTAKADLTEEQVSSFELVKNFVYDNSYSFTDTGDAAVTNSTVSVTVTAAAPTTYSVAITTTENGTVTADKTNAAAGETVNLTVTPAEGYELDTLTVMNGDTAVEVNDNAFTMPAGDVTVSAAFKQVITVTGYTFATSADVSTENGGTAVVHVKITGHSDENVTGYNAYDLTLTFDTDKLELATDEEGNYIYSGAVKTDNGSVTVNGNTIRIVGCGADKAFGTEIAALTFKTKAEGNANVTISKVQVSDKEESVKEDAPEATPKHDEDDTTADTTPDESIIVVPFSVTKPDFVSGNDKAVAGDDYTFSYSDTTNYTYSGLKVTVGGTEVTPAEADGVYTIENVTGAIVIEATRTANSYKVNKPANVIGHEKATYGTDYVFTVTPDVGKEIDSVKATIGGKEIAVTKNTEGGYEIAGGNISGEITITVTQKDVEVPETKYTNISFSGITQAEIEGGQLTQKVEAGKEFTFKLIKTEGVTYTVKIGEEVLIAGEDGTYTISAAKMIEGDLTVTIEKAEIINVEVAEYIKLDGQAMFLITAKSAATDSVLKYGEETMYRSSKYGAYGWLVISAESDDTVKAQAQAAIAIAETGTTAPEVAYNYDVNGTSKVDVNDAQLAYDMYNAAYSAFTENLTIKKFLEADLDGSKNLGTQDVAAIINFIVNGTAN